ncbi:MAG: glycoside hydrolase family 3 protein [Acidobacteriota bacterium]|nr:MAG: glycoside hydrolase family 3 protein [Acidobacteriota bacterium]
METANSNNLNVGKHFLVGLPGAELDPAATDLLDEVRPGGVILFARNIKSCEQTRLLLDEIVGKLGYRPLIAVDQEGGLVDRLRRVLSPLPAAAKMLSADDARRLGRLAGEPLSILGFNLDLAPVVDVMDGSRSDRSNGLYSRIFGDSKEQASEFAEAFITGLAKFGILGCLKHFPGLSAARVDSHEELPVVDIDREELDEIDLFPYRRLLDRDRCAVMIGHAVYPNTNLQAIRPDGRLLPSSLDDGIVNGLLRRDLGFDGLVITDDLEMGAIVNTYGIGDACVKAMNAGNDMLAICAKPQSILAGFRAVQAAADSGDISGDVLTASSARIERFGQNIAEPRQFDESRLNEIAREIEDFARGVE